MIDALAGIARPTDLMLANSRHRIWLILIAALYVAMSVVGITWGLPTRSIDPYLFGDDEPWSGDKIYRLASAGEKLSGEAIRSRGADVDVDPVRESRGPHRIDDDEKSTGATGGLSASADSSPSTQAEISPGLADSEQPINLTATDEDVARIYLRYRLYTYQPDEMITMMALAGMKPGKLQFDPRLYQYGGLWIYPVGALIKLCGVVGLIDVRSDLVFYLEFPEEFGKFYIVARAFAAAWGLIGVFVVFGITRRLVGRELNHQDTRTPRGETVEENRHEATNKGNQSQIKDRRSEISDSKSQITIPESQVRAARAGLLAALLFSLMPVVVCMAHEGKPHLPGAVLMLMAVYFAIRATQRPANFSSRRRSGAKKSSSLGARGTTPQDHDATERKEQARGERGYDRADVAGSNAHSAFRISHSTFDIRHSAFFWLMCLSCGAAVGMVLSSGPIIILIPLVAWMRLSDATHETRHADVRAASARERSVQSQIENRKSKITSVRVSVREWLVRTVLGTLLALAVYSITNPYVLINAIFNRHVLASNFGNSLSMYEIARIGEGFLRVLELTIEGATLPIVVLGFLALFVAIFRRHPLAIPLIAAAGVFFLQFVLIGAGKPAEYGRFGIFPNTALAIGTAILLTRRWTSLKVNWMPSVLVVMWGTVLGGSYLVNFYIDTTRRASRFVHAKSAGKNPSGVLWGSIGVLAEPAPYNLPAVNFSRNKVLLFRSKRSFAQMASNRDDLLIIPVENSTWHSYDTVGNEEQRLLGGSGTARPTRGRYLRRFERTPISWANKPFDVYDGIGAHVP